MKRRAVLILIIIMSVSVLFACNKKNDKPTDSISQSGSQDITSSSFYDDDWYIDSQSDKDDSQNGQSVSGSDPSSDTSGISYQEDDEAEWCPFY